MIRLFILFILSQFLLTGLDADDRKWKRDRNMPDIPSYEFDFDKPLSKIEGPFKRWLDKRIEEDNFKPADIWKAVERKFRTYEDRRRDRLHKQHKSNPKNLHKELKKFDAKIDRFEMEIQDHMKKTYKDHMKALEKEREKAEKEARSRLRKEFDKALKNASERREEQLEGDVAEQIRNSLKDRGLTDDQIEKLRTDKLRKIRDRRAKRVEEARDRRGSVETDIAEGRDRDLLRKRIKADSSRNDRPFKNKKHLEFEMRKRGYTDKEIAELLEDI